MKPSLPRQFRSRRPVRWRNALRPGIACLSVLLLFVACAPAITRQAASIQPQGDFSETGQAPLPEKWWLSFADPTLNRLIDLSQSENLTLQTAWDRLDRARAVARQAGAELIPQIDGSAGYTKTRSRVNGFTDSSHSYNLGLAASYEIDLWGRIGSNIEAAELDVRATAEDLQTAALTLSAQVASTWFQWLEQQGQIDILRKQLATNRQTLELVNLQFRTGQVGIADVLQQRQVVENGLGELSLAKGRGKLLENQLAILVGTLPDAEPELTMRPFGDLPPLPATGLRSELLERRPDVRAAWLRVLAADQRVASAVADRFPRVSLTGRATTTAEQIEQLFDDWLTSLTASLLAPIIDGGRRRAEVDRTRAVTAEALHNYGQAVLQAVTEVEDALAEEQHQQEYLASIDRQLILATQATERIRDRYLNGAEDYQRVLISLLSEQQLQRTRITARRELFEYRINLCRSLAGGWPMSRPAGQASSWRE